MIKKKPAGWLATAWGISVPVQRSADCESGYSLDLEAAAIRFGVYDHANRQRLIAAAKAGGLIYIETFGGRQPPSIKLPVPSRFVYDQLPPDEAPESLATAQIRRHVDQWVTLISDQVRWCDRATVLLFWLECNRDAVGALPIETAGRGLSSIITAMLENLGEPDIPCLEAAAFYMLATHPGWREAGRSWLAPCHETWFADWAGQRPGYQRLAKLSRAVFDDVPPWATCGEAQGGTST